MTTGRRKSRRRDGGTPIEVGAGLVEVCDAAKEAEEVRGQEAGETKVAGGFEETVLIVDDEPMA